MLYRGGGNIGSQLCIHLCSEKSRVDEYNRTDMQFIDHIATTRVTSNKLVVVRLPN